MKTLIIIYLLIFLISCEEKSNKDYKTPISEVNINSNQEESELFINQYKNFCGKEVEDERIIDFLVKNFSNNSSKNNEFYLYFFCYLLNVNNEDASEGIGSYMFEFYKNNPEKLKSFTDKVNEFNEGTKNKIIDRFIVLLSLDMYAEDYTEDDFKKNFEGLLIYKTSISTFKKCQDNW